MSYKSGDELPEYTGELGASYIQVLEGLAIGDIALLGASKQLLDARAPFAQTIERGAHRVEGCLLTGTGVVNPIFANKLVYDSLRSMVYSGNYIPGEHTESVRTCLALLGKNRKWVNRTLNLSGTAIEAAHYTERGFGSHARRLAKEAKRDINGPNPTVTHFLVGLHALGQRW